MANPAIPCIDPRTLSWWAEAADVHRDTGSYLVNDNGVLSLKRADSAPPAGTLVIINQTPEVDTPCGTPTTPPAPTPAAKRIGVKIGFTPDAGTYASIEEVESERCDAFFTSPSAIRKFLLPYYEAHRLLDDCELKALRLASTLDAVAGIAHFPPSHSYDVGPNGKITKITTEQVYLKLPGLISPISLSDFLAPIILTL